MSDVGGAYCRVYGLRSTVCSLRSTFYGLWSMVHGRRSTVDGLRSSVYRLSRRVNCPGLFGRVSGPGLGLEPGPGYGVHCQCTRQSLRGCNRMSGMEATVTGVQGPTSKVQGPVSRGAGSRVKGLILIEAGSTVQLGSSVSDDGLGSGVWGILAGPVVEVLGPRSEVRGLGSRGWGFGVRLRDHVQSKIESLGSSGSRVKALRVKGQGSRVNRVDGQGSGRGCRVQDVGSGAPGFSLGPRV
eukprot:3232288-Rhodomonas_salina.2